MSGDRGWVFAQECCQGPPTFPRNLNPYLLRSDRYYTHTIKVAQTPQGSDQTEDQRAPQTSGRLKRASYLLNSKALKVDKCNGCRHHQRQEPKYLSLTQFQCKTTPQKFPNTFLQCYFTSIEFKSRKLDTSFKLYSSRCMIVIHCQFQLT